MFFVLMGTGMIFKRLTVLLILLPVVLHGTMAQAGSKSATERAFSAWLQGPMWRKAQASGISSTTYGAAFRPVKLNWSLPDLRPPGKPPSSRPPRQSEFRAPGHYFKARYVDYNVTQGKRELQKWRPTLKRIEQRYGVPREIIIAIWGKETAFGRARLPYPAIEVLATQAFMGRRKDLFERELLAALTILQEGHIRPPHMKSAWAGALGHPQFMPSTFLKYAVDFDGDGRKNIWSSVPDALASIAHFLHQKGWDSTRRWGHEIVLPANAPCTLEGPEQRITTRQWRTRGVRRIDRRPFAKKTLDKHGFLLLPAGRHGPVFLVSNNFYVLKAYNESDVYALFIALTADRMAGRGGFQRKWRKLDSYSRRAVKRAQQQLVRQGHDVGGADGLIGFKTRIAIGLWQEENSELSPTCFPSRRTLRDISENK